MNRVTVPVLVVDVRRVVVFNFASLTLAQMLFNRSCCVLLLGGGARNTRALSDLFLSGNFLEGDKNKAEALLQSFSLFCYFVNWEKTSNMSKSTYFTEHAVYAQVLCLIKKKRANHKIRGLRGGSKRRGLSLQ